MRNLQMTPIPAGRDGINRSKNLELLRPSHLAAALAEIPDLALQEQEAVGRRSS